MSHGSPARSRQPVAASAGAAALSQAIGGTTEKQEKVLAITFDRLPISFRRASALPTGVAPGPGGVGLTSVVGSLMVIAPSGFGTAGLVPFAEPAQLTAAALPAVTTSSPLY